MLYCILLICVHILASTQLEAFLLSHDRHATATKSQWLHTVKISFSLTRPPWVGGATLKGLLHTVPQGPRMTKAPPPHSHTDGTQASWPLRQGKGAEGSHTSTSAWDGITATHSPLVKTNQRAHPVTGGPRSAICLGARRERTGEGRAREGSIKLFLMMLLALSSASSTVVPGRLTFFICRGMGYT